MVVFHRRQEHNQLPHENGMDNGNNHGDPRDYLHHHIYNFRKVGCDPLRQIKRHMYTGNTIHEELFEFALAPLGQKPPD